MMWHLYSPESAVAYKLNYFPHLLSCLLYNVFYLFFNVSLYLAYDVAWTPSNTVFEFYEVVGCVYYVNNCSLVFCFVNFLIKSSFKKRTFWARTMY